MEQSDAAPIARLYAYLAAFVSGQMDTRAFCGSFEQVFNFELDKSLLSASEVAALSALLKRISWYSPFPEERQRIKNYIGEEEVLAAAKETISKLQALRHPG